MPFCARDMAQSLDGKADALAIRRGHCACICDEIDRKEEELDAQKRRFHGKDAMRTRAEAKEYGAQAPLERTNRGAGTSRPIHATNTPVSGQDANGMRTHIPTI